jgi:hypothetical protein
VIALVVVAFFGGFEVITRHMLYRSSKDLRRFATYPARARALMAAPGPHVVFFGNSMTERGIDPQLFARTLGISADLFAADESHINTWIWMVNKELWSQHLSPELVIVSFNRSSLYDGQKLEIGRIAQFFASRTDWPELFASDTVTLTQRAELVLGSVWGTFAVRDRLKEWTLGQIPGYKAYLKVENEVIKADERDKGTRRPAVRTLTTLDRFLARAQENHTHVLFVAFPSRADKNGIQYDVAQPLIDEIQAAGMSYLDLRVVPELDPARHYDDDLHLNAEGRRIYTLRLCDEVRRLRLLEPAVTPATPSP